MTEAQISGANIFAASYTVVDIGASCKITPAFTFHGGVQNPFDNRLSYDASGYVVDPARIWMGAGVRF